MSLFRKSGEHLPAKLPAECLGEQCPEFKGTACESYEEWVSAKATRTKGRDTSQPPLKDEAIYIIYGQACMAGEEREMVAQRAEVHRPDEVNGMELIALTNRYGDMPVRIEVAGRIAVVETLATSEGK
jgi:hypothetical protein